MRRTMVALVAMASLVSVPAFAEEIGNYAMVKLGVYSPRSYFLTGQDFGNAFDGEIAFGHYYTPNVAPEVGVGYFRTTAGSDHITVVPLTLTGKGIIEVSGGELYAGAGIGAYFASSELGGVSYNDTAFGWQLLTGGNFNVMPNMFLGAEIRYIWVKPSFGSYESKCDGMTATANIGVRF